MTRDFLIKWLLSAANSAHTQLPHQERDRLREVAGQMVEDGKEITNLQRMNMLIKSIEVCGPAWSEALDRSAQAAKIWEKGIVQKLVGWQKAFRILKEHYQRASLQWETYKSVCDNFRHEYQFKHVDSEFSDQVAELVEESLIKEAKLVKVSKVRIRQHMNCGTIWQREADQDAYYTWVMLRITATLPEQEDV